MEDVSNRTVLIYFGRKRLLNISSQFLPLFFFQQIITIVQKFYNLLPKFAQSMARQGFGIIIMILIKALQSMINFVFCNNIKILVFLTFPSATVRRRRKNGNDFDKSWMNWISWRLNQGCGWKLQENPFPMKMSVSGTCHTFYIVDIYQSQYHQDHYGRCRCCLWPLPSDTVLFPPQSSAPY